MSSIYILKTIITILFLLGPLLIFSQNEKQLNEVLKKVRDYNALEADSLLQNLPESEEKKLLQWNVQVLVNGNQDTIIPESLSYNSHFSKILGTIQAAEIFLNKDVPKDSLAFTNFRDAFLFSKNTKDTLLINFAVKKLVDYLLNSNRQQNQLQPFYINEYKKVATSNSDIATASFYDINHIATQLREPKIKEFKAALEIAKKSENKYIQAKINQLIGVHFSYFLNEIDSSRAYSKKALAYYKNEDAAYIDYLLYVLNGNLGFQSLIEGKYKESLAYFKIAQTKRLPRNSHLKRSKTYNNLANIYRGLKKYDSAFYYQGLEKLQLDSLNEYKKAIALNETEVKYQTAEKEKQILIEKSDKERNQNIAIGLAGGLLAVTIIGFLIYKNVKREKDIAEKQREIEINKTEKILKEQEINTIDAMISGQEKERQRLACDLHDSVGATLAAARLQFEHLQKNRDKGAQTNELFNKTSKLLEDAYTEVRTMSHIKNSGVIAKQGLLPAVQKLAKNASVASALQIEVQDFGLNERLENTLEISVFRIIQELVTNIIKHANATEASISITQHEESLSIIVEDNGKGFIPLKIQKKEGMGLSSIERRIEHIEGTMEVDSTLGKGTSILIDIPL